jgi:biopolymer transport protein ExbB/TolQ
MDALEIVAWAMLVASSILAIAAVLAAVQQSQAYRRSKTSVFHADAGRCLAAIAKLSQSLPRLSRDQVRSELRQIAERARPAAGSDDLAAVLEYLLENVRHHVADIDAVAAGAHGVILARQRRLERGGQRLCGYLVKLGPWAGLTGTLAGVRESLAAFVRSLGAVQEFAAGFATAIDTTVFGILIAVVAFTTSRGIWAPLVEAQHAELTEHAIAAMTHLKRIYSHLSDDDGPSGGPRDTGRPPTPPGPSPVSAAASAESSAANEVDARGGSNGGTRCLTNVIRTVCSQQVPTAMKTWTSRT